jgi:hypothetical protein
VQIGIQAPRPTAFATLECHIDIFQIVNTLPMPDAERDLVSWRDSACQPGRQAAGPDFEREGHAAAVVDHASWWNQGVTSAAAIARTIWFSCS